MLSHGAFRVPLGLLENHLALSVQSLSWYPSHCSGPLQMDAVQLTSTLQQRETSPILLAVIRMRLGGSHESS